MVIIPTWRWFFGPERAGFVAVLQGTALKFLADLVFVRTEELLWYSFGVSFHLESVWPRDQRVSASP